jgi:hypothetical protein
MPKTLLLIGYEYQGYHSPRGAALSRRVRQIAHSFAANGWNVTVIHKDCIDETKDKPFVKQKETPFINRIAVKATKGEYLGLDKIAPLRMLLTFYYLLYRGDRTYKWAKDVIRNHKSFNLATPDLIISCFTPRAPLLLGSFFTKLFGCKWIADFQDEVDQGNSNANKKLSYIWTRKILKRAHAIVQVSPEWAARDGRILGRKVEVIRHAVPADAPLPTTGLSSNIPYTIFYGGGINPEEQGLDVLEQVLSNFIGVELRILIAGHKNTFEYFNRVLGNTCTIEYAGWLNHADYKTIIANCHCVLIVPCSLATRQVVPSKFYEMLATKKTIWIVGNDSGAFNSIFSECNMPSIPLGNIQYQVAALQAALKGDFSFMFIPENCRKPLLTEKELFNSYMRFI